MPPRARRFAASIGMLAFLAFWIWGAVMIGERLPDIQIIKMIFFVVAGMGWGIPLIPLLRWAERVPSSKD